MYIVEYIFRKHHGTAEPIFSDYERIDRGILGYVENYEQGRDFMCRYYESTDGGMKKEDYKEEFFTCDEFAHNPNRNEVRSWKKWQTKDGESTKYFFIEELNMHYIHKLGDDPQEAINEYYG